MSRHVWARMTEAQVHNLAHAASNIVDDDEDALATLGSPHAVRAARAGLQALWAAVADPPTARGRFTTAEWNAIAEAIGFRLAGEMDDRTDAEVEALSRAAQKLGIAT